MFFRPSSRVWVGLMLTDQYPVQKNLDHRSRTFPELSSLISREKDGGSTPTHYLVLQVDTADDRRRRVKGMSQEMASQEQLAAQEKENAEKEGLQESMLYSLARRI